METDSYSANQRRAINLVWTACGDYQFEPQFLALKADGTPDFYMNCVIGLVGRHAALRVRRPRVARAGKRRL
mgnify:CR=1 FL=1